ncbi:MAG: hypothetical protein Kow0096_03870 [Thiohalomonadaceae bacterium]
MYQKTVQGDARQAQQQSRHARAFAGSRPQRQAAQQQHGGYTIEGDGEKGEGNGHGGQAFSLAGIIA